MPERPDGDPEADSEDNADLDSLELLAREAFAGYERSVGDRYQLLEEIGSGGIGVIFRGIDRELERGVAIKLLRHRHAWNQRALRRFRDEARKLIQTDSTNGD